MPKSGNAADRDVKMDDKYGPTSPAKKTLGVRGLGRGLGGMRRLVAVGVSVGRIVGGRIVRGRRVGGRIVVGE